MKDKLQSLVILVLIISSVYLLFLNFGMEPRDIFEETKVPEEEAIYPSQALMEDVIKPEILAINFGSDHHTLIVNPLRDSYWAEIKKVIQTVFQDPGFDVVSLDSISDEIYNQLLRQRSLYMTFNEGLSTLTILNALKAESTPDLAEKFPNIDSLYISLERPFVVIKSGGNTKLLTFDSLPTEELNVKVANLFLDGYNSYELAENILDGNLIDYIPEISKHKIEKITFTNLLATLDRENIENIINKFFQKDLNLVREIKEEGVQTIYVDGDKILKISNEGLISYYNPQLPKIKERNLYISLESALSFISNNLGFDDSLYLKEIKPIEVSKVPGFKITFGKAVGSYKVQLEDEKIVDYIEVDVFNNHILRLAQYFRGQAEERKEYFTVSESQNLRPTIAKNLDKINNQLQKPKAWSLEQAISKIEKARVFYKDTGGSEPLEIYWLVTIEGQDFEFKIDY